MLAGVYFGQQPPAPATISDAVATAENVTVATPQPTPSPVGVRQELEALLPRLHAELERRADEPAGEDVTGANI